MKYQELPTVLRKNGFEVLAKTRGHNFNSLFAKRLEDGQLWYFLMHDTNNQILYRTAKHLKDYTGGSNHFGVRRWLTGLNGKDPGGICWTMRDLNEGGKGRYTVRED